MDQYNKEFTELNKIDLPYADCFFNMIMYYFLGTEIKQMNYKTNMMKYIKESKGQYI
jgi:hypothetical protein